ncbi:MAG: metalloregulator ArsR/SmtB family transcription factor [Lachnospiraceae bacterium]|nr:metalloregulator ArsR/SmtB family transcription factor [Lachnospiraceae bacterium]
MGKKKKNKKREEEAPVKKKKLKSEKLKKSATGAAKLSLPETELPMLPVFQALSDENRLKIIRLLTIRERTTPELLEQVDVVQSTMSHHLKILTEAGLISCQKKGKRSCYSIRPDTFAQIGAYFISQNPSIND